MDVVLNFIEIFGVVAFAMSGLIEGRKRGLDIFGIYFVALVTALGGGTVRDVLINNYPVFMIEHPEYPIIVLGLSLASFFGRGAILTSNRMTWTVVLFDALGLGLFSASGISLSLAKGLSAFNAVLMGIITGVFGGVIRDIICNEIPVVFRRTELYVTCILIGVIGYLLLLFLFHQPFGALAACIVLTFFSRMLAHKYQWRLPV